MFFIYIMEIEPQREHALYALRAPSNSGVCMLYSTQITCSTQWVIPAPRTAVFIISLFYKLELDKQVKKWIAELDLMIFCFIVCPLFGDLWNVVG